MAVTWWIGKGAEFNEAGNAEPLKTVVLFSQSLHFI